MAIRVSRQRPEVLVLETGNVYISRQIVEVLVPYSQIHEKSASSALNLTQQADRESAIVEESGSSSLSLSDDANSNLKYVSASSTLALTQETGFPFTHEETASSTLALTDSAVNSGLITVSASSTLDLIQYADDETKARDIAQILTLIDTASVDKILQGFSQLELTSTARTAKELLASSELTLTQIARQKVQKLYATSQIEFSQDTRTNPRYLSVTSTLELSDSNIVTKPIRVSATSEMTTEEEVWVDTEFVTVQTGLRQEASVNGFIALSASSVIPLIGSAAAHVALATGISASASSQINWTQKAIPEAIEESATSTLVLTQAAWGAAGKPGLNTLSLTGVATATIDRGLAGTTTLELEQAVTYTLIIGSTKCQYSPFVGDATDEDLPSPPPAEIDGPMAGIQVPFQLVYPSLGAVTDSVSLKTPNLGNKDRLSFNRVLRETRGGTLIVYADPIWPKVQTLVLTFSGLLRVEAHELLAFIDAYLGQEIGLIDWEQRYWRGVITTPDEPAVEDRFDSFTVSLSFEGELDPTWNPQIVPPGLRYSAIRSEQQDGYYVPIPPQLPSPIETSDYHSAEADSTIQIGNPLYLTGAGHVNPAQANAAGTTQVVGLSISDITAGFICNYLTEGRIERSNWTDIAGVTTLSAGRTYFLDPTTAGRITSTAPTVASQFVVRVGRAVSTTVLDIEIELPILL